MKTREEIDSKYKIDLTKLFKTKENFYTELDNFKNDMKEILKFEGHILDNENSLLELLKLSDSLDQRLERLYIYAHIHNDCDLANKEYNEYYGNTMKTYTEYSSICSYIVPELLESDYKIVNDFILKKEELKKYERMLKEIYKSKKHSLSKKEEYILSKLSDIFGISENAYSKLTDVDLKFGTVIDDKGQEIELTESNWASLIESKNRDVRKNVFEKFFTAYKSINNTISELMAGEVKKHNVLSELRNYDSAMQASLDNDDVSDDVYKTLIKSIDKNKEIMYKQWDIRKKVLGLDEIHLYDSYVPLVKNYEKKYSHEEAKDVILKALGIMGKDYIDNLEKFFSEKRIDVFPNKNKRGGAYCTCCYLTDPYVLTNFDESYSDVSTLAHELGHGMHYHYAKENQEYVNYNYKIFVAEVASQVNEILLAKYVLNNSTNIEEKKFILDHLIKGFKASVIRQTMFSEYEYKIHELEKNGNVLTTDLLNETYYELNKKYFGNRIVIDDLIKYEWSRIPHFYYNFYVYQYATGYVAALKLANDIYNQKEGSLDKYLEFLKLGCTKDPVESLKIAGIDLTDEKNYDEAFKEFDLEMEEFISLCEKE